MYRLITAVDLRTYLTCWRCHGRLLPERGEFLTKHGRDDGWLEQRGQGFEQVAHPQQGYRHTLIVCGQFDNAAHVSVEEADAERSLPLSTWIAQVFAC